jgi:hypothetical protein
MHVCMARCLRRCMHTPTLRLCVCGYGYMRPGLHTRMPACLHVNNACLLHAWPRYRGACSAACVVSYLHTSSCACICSSVDTHRRRGGAKRRGAQRRGARMPACMHAYAHRHTSTQAYAHRHTSIRAYAHTSTYTSQHTRCSCVQLQRSRMYARMRVCVYACF